MTVALIDINERLVSNFSKMNYKGLWQIVVQLCLRYCKLHMVYQIHTFDIIEMSNKGLRVRDRCFLVQNDINNSNLMP